MDKKSKTNQYNILIIIATKVKKTKQRPTNIFIDGNMEKGKYSKDNLIIKFMILSFPDTLSKASDSGITPGILLVLNKIVNREIHMRQVKCKMWSQNDMHQMRY